MTFAVFTVLRNVDIPLPDFRRGRGLNTNACGFGAIQPLGLSDIDHALNSVNLVPEPTTHEHLHPRFFRGILP